LLIRPILFGGYDFVAPYYQRHKYDGTITNSIVYPLTRMLYGLSVRQPIGGEFGVSARLIGRYLECEDWETDVARFGIDIWMTTIAIAEGFRVCQSFLGAFQAIQRALQRPPPDTLPEPASGQPASKAHTWSIGLHAGSFTGFLKG
jgi:hypothetical protein